MSITRLYLIRHGETIANQSKPPILQGKGLDHPLNDLGLRQARILGKVMEGVTLSAVYSSGMQRAAQTAQQVAATRGLAVQKIDLLHEIDVGVWQGQTWDEARRAMPAEYAACRKDPVNCPNPGGESYSDVLNRVAPILADLFSRHAGESFAVVSHSAVNRVYLAHVLGLDLRAAMRLRQENCAINVLEIHEEKPLVVSMNAHVPFGVESPDNGG